VRRTAVFQSPGECRVFGHRFQVVNVAGAAATTDVTIVTVGAEDELLEDLPPVALRVLHPDCPLRGSTAASEGLGDPWVTGIPGRGVRGSEDAARTL